MNENAEIKIFMVMSFDRRYENVYRVVQNAVGEASEIVGKSLKIFRADEKFFTVSIQKHLFDCISEADIIIADVGSQNSNVMYDLGLTHGLRKPVILISESLTDLPAAIMEYRILIYDVSRLETSFKGALVDQLVKVAKEPLKSSYPFASKEANAEKPSPTIFISYSHADKEFLSRLRVHIRPLEKNNQIELWDDTKIQAGALWKDEIRNALNRAAIAILLISADFLASDFIVDNELPPILKAAEEKGTTILPIILKPCRFVRDRNLSVFQAINNPKEPLIMLTEAEREEIYAQLAERIENEVRSKD